MKPHKKHVVKTIEEKARRLRENGVVGSYETDAAHIKVAAISYAPEINKRNVYVHDLQPILSTLRILGALCYRVTPSGEVRKVPLISCFGFYALLVTGTMMAITAALFLERVPMVGRPGVPFLDRIIDVGFTILFSPCWITPLTLCLEHRKMIKFFTQWEIFQTHYTKVTGKQLNLGLRRRCLISLSIVLISSGIVTVNALFVGKKGLKSVWQSAGFTYALLLGFLIPCVWYLTCNALNKAGTILALRLDQCYQHHTRLTELRHLWRSLSSLTREMGSAMGLTCGALSLIYLSVQTLALYAALYLILDGQSPAQIFIFLSSSFIFAGLLYLQCDAAGKATDRVGEKFQQHLEDFALAHSGANSDLHKEISVFLQTIQISPPGMTYSGFADVNQHLMISLMSSIATYIIVLLQFQIGLQQSTKTN